MKALFFKELRYYLDNPVGYIIIGLFAVLANFFFVKDIFVVGSASMRPFFELIPWLFLVFVPALSMRMIAEERRSNTIETLLALPVSELQIVLAKFLTLIALISIGLMLTLGLPIALVAVSDLYVPELLIGYLGLILCGGLFAAVSLFFSSLTRNQVVAFLSSIVVLFFFLVMSTDVIATVIPRAVMNVLQLFDPFTYLRMFFKGLLDIRAVIYFFSFSILLLLITVINVEKRS
ncbi:MAG: ABC transporter permease subunit [Patescibacteria group bacterium]